MPNARVFYAMQGVLLLQTGKNSITYSGASSATIVTPYPEFIYGLQDIGLNTSFNLEQVFQQGQLSLYQNVEEVPDVEITLSKVLDGRPLIWHMATPKATAAGLSGRSGVNDKCDFRMAIIQDVDSAFNAAANNRITGEVFCSGVYVSQISYSLSAEGNSTESVTLVGNNKLWNTQTIMSGNFALGTDSPNWSASQGNLDSVIRRKHFDITNSIIPIDIPGYSAGDLTGAAALEYGYKLGASNGKTHMSSVNISTSLGRTPLYELGRKGPYYRSADFPVEVTCGIEVISLSGDLVQSYEEGFPATDTNRGITSGDNLGNRRIQIMLTDGTIFNLGNKNKLANVTYGGAGAGGGNASMTFNYSNFNDLEIFHSGDPANLSRAYSLLTLL